MKELFYRLPDLDEAKNVVLLDTSFLISVFEGRNVKKLEKLCKKKKVTITSFNADETVLKAHDIKDKVREGIRKFLKKKLVYIYKVPVHPGFVEEEIGYVEAIDHTLLEDIPDHSDAVIMAAAVRLKADVLTKDKHHLFQEKLKNYIKDYKIHVWKDFSSVK